MSEQFGPLPDAVGDRTPGSALPPAGPTAPPPSVTRVGLLLGTLVALTVIGSSAVAVALPETARELGLDTSGMAWVLAVFSLAFSITTAIFGRLADLRGLRAPLRIGVLMLAAGSVVAATAPTFPVLVAGRVLQGAGAGSVPVLGLGIIAARFSGEARGKALGAITAVVSIVSGSGPLIGGAVAQVASWRWVLAVPALALLLVEPVARLAPTQPSTKGRLDLRGALLVGAVVTAATMLLQAPSTRIAPRLVALLAGVAVAAAALLVLHVRARPAGLLPRAVVTDRQVVLSAVAGLTLLAAYLGGLLAVPVILALEQQWTPLQIGLSLLGPAVFGAVTSRLVGGVAARVGRSRVAAGLAVGSAGGLLLVAALHARPLFLLVGMALVFAAFGGGQVALVDALTNHVEESVRGVALGVFNLVFFMGGAIGAATVGGLSGLVSLSTALGILAVLPALGAVAAWRLGRA